MGTPPLSALIVLSAWAASAAVMVWLVRRESGRRRARRPGRPDATPILSPDSFWLWSGAAWVPTQGVAVRRVVAVPAPARAARSNGCATAAAVGCAVFLAALGLACLALLAGLILVAAALASALGV